MKIELDSALAIQAQQVALYASQLPDLTEIVAAHTSADALTDGWHDVTTINKHIPRGWALEQFIAKANFEPLLTLRTVIAAGFRFRHDANGFFAIAPGSREADPAAVIIGYAQRSHELASNLYRQVVDQTCGATGFPRDKWDAAAISDRLRLVRQAWANITYRNLDNVAVPITSTPSKPSLPDIQNMDDWLEAAHDQPVCYGKDAGTSYAKSDFLRVCEGDIERAFQLFLLRDLIDESGSLTAIFSTTPAKRNTARP